MAHLTSRRLRRLEAHATELLLRRQAARLAADLGGPADRYVPELRRIDRVIGAVIAQLPPSRRHDPAAIVRGLAAAEHIDPVELLGEAKRLAREQPL
jgi:hypothetical protein